MRKLRDLGGADGYTATGLAFVSWTDDPDDHRLTIELDEVPEDIRPEQFMLAMINQVLAATPVTQHVDVHSLLERRTIPVVEDDAQLE